jgi:hypothetical protein
VWCQLLLLHVCVALVDSASEMVKEIKGAAKVPHTNLHTNETVEIDFTPPFRRLSIMSELEKQMQVGQLPDPNNAGGSI